MLCPLQEIPISFSNVLWKGQECGAGETQSCSKVSLFVELYGLDIYRVLVGGYSIPLCRAGSHAKKFWRLSTAINAAVIKYQINTNFKFMVEVVQNFNEFVKSFIDEKIYVKYYFNRDTTNNKELTKIILLLANQMLYKHSCYLLVWYLMISLKLDISNTYVYIFENFNIRYKNLQHQWWICLFCWGVK